MPRNRDEESWYADAPYPHLPEHIHRYYDLNGQGGGARRYAPRDEFWDSLDKLQRDAFYQYGLNANDRNRLRVFYLNKHHVSDAP